MLTLGLETSGRTASLALLDGDQLRATRSTGDSGRRPAQDLFPILRDVLQEHGYHASDLERVAVSIGPGSFTGLRIGVALAKTLAWATKAEAVPVDTFAAIAENVAERGAGLFVIADAQRKGLFVGEDDPERESEQLWPIRIESAAEFFASRAAEQSLIGPGLSVLKPETECLATRLPESMWHPQAETIARLGLRRSPVDPLALLPRYLRRSAAEEKADAASARES